MTEDGVTQLIADLDGPAGVKGIPGSACHPSSRFRNTGGSSRLASGPLRSQRSQGPELFRTVLSCSWWFSMVGLGLKSQGQWFRYLRPEFVIRRTVRWVLPHLA